VQRSHPRSPKDRTYNVDARMMPLVPKKTTAQPGQLIEELSDLLLSALEFIGAAAGWIGLQDAGGALSFPVRGGTFSEGWLPWQHEHGSVWGFAVGEPTLLNDLQPRTKLVTPALHNLLSCPLIHDDQILGHIALANKANGFTGHDSVVLQGLAYHMARMLGRRSQAVRAPIELPTPWRRIFDRAEEGILVLDEVGLLIYTNATWLDWTGFRADELLGRTAPFPFWVSQQDLVRALAQIPAVPANLLPFRRRDQSTFWCRLETMTEHWDDQAVTVAFLRSTTVTPASTAEDEPSGPTAVHQPKPPHPPTSDWLPLLLDLDDGIEGWSARWEEQTGLSANDVEGGRCELVLDWLFPQQYDRDRVADCFHHPRPGGCQFILELASPDGSRPMVCTFLPLPTSPTAVISRRWLLLVSEGELVAEATALDGSIHRNPAHILSTPHSHGEHTIPPGEN